MADPSLSTEDTFNPTRSILVAITILIIAAIAIFALNPKRTAVLTVPQVATFAPHTESKAAPGPAGTHVLGPAANSEDDLYVAATVHLENKLHVPIFVSYATATMKTADGSEVAADVINTQDIPNLEVTFPAISPLLPHPLLNGAQISAGTSTEGEVLLLFTNGTQKTWDSKKSATLTLHLLHQDPISVPLN